MAQVVASQQITDVLNKQIANFAVLFVKLHNYHWFVKGPQFFELHVKFEQFYTEAGTIMDQLAENLLTIQGKPLASMSEFLRYSSISEASGNENAMEMVKNIANDFQTVLEELKAGIEAANTAKLDSIADLLIGMQNQLNIHSWMLNSYLQA